MKDQHFFSKAHLKYAHLLWEAFVMPNDLIIDATCGNGNDTLFLAQLAPQGVVHAFDIQKSAIEKCQKKTKMVKNVCFYHQCHSEFPKEILPESIKLIVYNLGYLPGGDKRVTTLWKTTQTSIIHSLKLLMPSALISITCYPGHEEGKHEKQELMKFIKQLNPKRWWSYHHKWTARLNAPSLILIRPV